MHKIFPRPLTLCVSLLAWDCQAQNITSPEEERVDAAVYESVLEEVIVTGSRLIRSNLDSPSPVTIYSSEELIGTGVMTLEDFARYLPQNVDTFSDSGVSDSPLKGSAAFNLRGIGLDGTLTLVNGRRVAPFGSSGGTFPFVDINAIPVAAIKRIEVLKDGASAIYGSEAVAGVVNIITHSDFEGVTVAGGYLNNSKGDGSEWDVSVTAGWKGEATRLTGTFSYYEREAIWARDRDFSSEIDFSEQGGFNLRSVLSSPPSIGLLSTFRQFPDPACPQQTEINSIRILVEDIQVWCVFNWTQFTYLQHPSNRLGISAGMEHDINPKLAIFGEVLYSHNQTQDILAPTPYTAIVPAFHPNNSYGEDVLVAGRAADTPPRNFDTDSVTWRALAGLRGQWSTWQWEAALMFSEAEGTNTRANAILEQPFQAAIQGFGGSGGDQFYNPFGLNPENPTDVTEQFLISGTRKRETSKETTVDFQANRQLIEMGGGPLGLALGFQARKQELTQTADEEERGGQILGENRFDPISADRDIFSLFAETLMPIHETFEVQLAVRYDHYSDFGGTTNPKIGLGWRPKPELLVRATWGTSFRPPTFRELHNPKTTSFGLSPADPHRCQATGDFFDCIGFRNITVEFQGNPDLKPDEGETRLIGIAWEPLFAHGLALSVDYWSINHDSRIIESNIGAFSDALLEQLDPFNNPFIIRAPPTVEDINLGIPGIIIGQSDTYINGGKLETAGVDFDLKYVLDTARAGTFTGSLNYTYLSKYDFGSDFMGVTLSEDLAGGYGFNGGLPKHRANFRMGWIRGAHGVSLLIPYVGEFESPTNLVVDEQETEIPYVIDDYLQLDLQYSYSFERLNGAVMRLGCRNCTNKEPPINNYMPFSAAFHEGRGAMLYLRWSQPFR